MRNSTPSRDHQTLLSGLALAWLLFIVYGSLLPFAPQALSLSEAWVRFQSIPWLDLGVGSRADWVANLLLYVPLGFLLSGVLVGRSQRVLVWAIGFVLVLSASMLLALGIEFFQQFFPPRTVSLNDLAAESVGTLLGIILWLVLGPRALYLLEQIQQGGRQARKAFLFSYAFVFIALSLFPYDFLISTLEWELKLASGMVGWWFAPACGQACALKMIPEAMSILPLGLLLALALGEKRRVSLPVAAILGVFLGGLIEVLQLSIASGISQGASVISRGLGMAGGAAVFRLAITIDWSRVKPWARLGVMVGAIPYVGALTALNRWHNADWTSWQAGIQSLDTLRFIPFYYHYYTTETVAMVSLLYQAGMYLPVGMGIWIWQWARGRRISVMMSMMLAALLALIMEAAKLFIMGQRPDPTNILIAATSASLAHAILNLLSVPGRDSPAGSTPVRVAPPALPTGQADNNKPSFGMQCIGAAVLVTAALSVLSYPLSSVLGLVVLLALIAALWARPGWWPLWLLGLLPVLDFAPYTGRLFWSEFDTALLAILGVMYLRGRVGAIGFRIPLIGTLLVGAFTLSTFLALVIGLWPLAPLDATAFNSYTSSYNALRLAKPWFFALLFLPVLQYEWRNPTRFAGCLAMGMSLGLAYELAYVLWERVTFSGLFNFDTDYRITGSFPGMHIGGAYIEAYLVLALPFVLLWAWQKRSFPVTLIAAALYVLGAYAVMVTFSRGGQAAFALATILAVLGFAWVGVKEQARRMVGAGVLALIAVIALAVAWPIFTGKYSQSRLATTGKDIVTRTAHWSDALQIVAARGETVFGAGLGSFPAGFFWGSRVPARPATYAFETEQANKFLRVGNGEILYFEQIVDIEPDRVYHLSLNLRSNQPNAVLTVPLCEKALLYSFTCAWQSIKHTAPAGQWTRHEIDLTSKGFGPPGSMFPRPVKLSLFNATAGSLIDVDQISLRDEAGRELLSNGGFESGMTHWFFSTDSHLAWHVKNIFIHVLFEQGWVGLVVFGLLVGYVVLILMRKSAQQDPMSVTLLTALAAFLVVGMVDTVIDETRLGFVFYFLLLSALALCARPSAQGAHTPKRRRHRRHR